jgi:NADH-quinone oxidoreductase subunit M
MAEQVLSLMIFIPLIGMLVILCLPSGAHFAIRAAGVAATVPPLFLGVWLLTHFDPAAPGFQFVHRFEWIPQFDILDHVGIDGISITMVLLTELLSFLCMIA